MKNSAISGVEVIPLEKFVDERGSVLKMVKNTDSFFENFGEVYFSTVNPGIIKGWKIHNRMGQLFTVPHGKIHLVLFDDRDSSPSKGNIMEVILSPENHSLVKIPHGLWYSFKCMSHFPSIIANCADMPHEPGEGHSIPLNSKSIPYNWDHSTQPSI